MEQNKTELEKLHQSIATEINRAKKRMFKANREGADPYRSLSDFATVVLVDLPKIVKGEQVERPDDEETKDNKPFFDTLEEERVEAWAHGATSPMDDAYQDLCLISLLDYISEHSDDAEDIALTARNAVFRKSTSLLDHSVKLLKENFVEVTGKGGVHATN